MTYNVFSGTLNPTQSICVSEQEAGWEMCELCVSVCLCVRAGSCSCCVRRAARTCCVTCRCWASSQRSFTCPTCLVRSTC